MSTTTLRWIESNGGPLLLLSEELLAEWQGADGPVGSTTDFERACATTQPIERIRVGRGVGLVLGDEPLSTAWLPAESGAGGTIVRLVRAADHAAAERALQEAPASASREGDMLTLPVAGRMVLFDAAHRGTDLPPTSLEIVVRGGEYQVDTLSFQPDPGTALLLHRLAPR